MGAPVVVTGALSHDSRLVHSGQQRGIRYEVYYDPSPETAYRYSPSGTRITPRGWRAGLHYATVFFTPYESDKHGVGVEPEQIGFAHDVEGASQIASDYITRIWQQQQPGYKPRTRRR